MATTKYLPATPNCFDGQPVSPDVAKATLYILKQLPNGKGANATGFVVANSAPSPDQPNRILTAGHVAEDDPRTIYRIAAPDGTYLGRANVVAGKPSKEGNLGQETTSDTTVLELQPASPEALAYFKRIPGLSLAATQSNQPYYADYRGGAGPVGGTSGGPVLDSNGQVIGVLVSGQGQDKTYPITARDMTAVIHSHANDEPLPPASIQQVGDGGYTLIAPVTRQETLSALGSAGQKVQPVNIGANATDATIVGYPGGVCIASKAQIVPAGRNVRPRPVYP